MESLVVSRYVAPYQLRKQLFDAAMARQGVCATCGKTAALTGTRSCAPGLCVACYEHARRKLKCTRRPPPDKFRNFRLCGFCRKAFTPARADAMTCSSRCRQKAYRKRLARRAPLSVFEGHWADGDLDVD
jgi:hypothetical protein